MLKYAVLIVASLVFLNSFESCAQAERNIRLESASVAEYVAATAKFCERIAPEMCESEEEETISDAEAFSMLVNIVIDLNKRVAALEKLAKEQQ